MRTKRLIIAAAALAAGVISSQAQSNVYSANIVGYVNKTIPSGYSLIENPLSGGVTNGANEVMQLIDGSQFLTWDNASSTFGYTSYDSGFGGWIDSNFNPANPPVIPPGRGFFFFNPGAPFTNTFVGTVVPAPGATNSLALPSGYALVGSPLAVAGQVHTAVALPLIDGLQILQWNNAASTYVYSSYDSGFGGWIDSGFNNIAEPTVTTAEGFYFFNPGAAAQWTQVLP